MTDRRLLELAKDTLNHDEFRVWVTKHYAGNGRRSGSLALGITEDSWRYRLRSAEQKMNQALEQENAA